MLKGEMEVLTDAAVKEKILGGGLESLLSWKARRIRITAC